MGIIFLILIVIHMLKTLSVFIWNVYKRNNFNFKVFLGFINIHIYISVCVYIYTLLLSLSPVQRKKPSIEYSTTICYTYIHKYEKKCCVYIWRSILSCVRLLLPLNDNQKGYKHLFYRLSDVKKKKKNVGGGRKGGDVSTMTFTIYIRVLSSQTVSNIQTNIVSPVKKFIKLNS